MDRIMLRSLTMLLLTLLFFDANHGTRLFARSGRRMAGLLMPWSRPRRRPNCRRSPIGAMRPPASTSRGA